MVVGWLPPSVPDGAQAVSGVMRAVTNRALKLRRAHLFSLVSFSRQV